MAENELPVPPSEPVDDPAVTLIRSRLEELYRNEPSVRDEIKEIEQGGATSKHQLKMKSLMESGDSIAAIQTAWHEYYQGLSDDEKHIVWKEFYGNQNRGSQTYQPQPVSTPEQTSPQQPKPKKHTKTLERVRAKAPKPPQTVAELKEKIAARVSADGRLTAKHHFKSLMFGFSTAAFVGLIVIFVMFNQLFVAPFVTPSKTASATPLIVDPTGQAFVGPEPRIIIPKINVDAPLVLDASSNAEKDIQKALEKGVTLYPDTGKPGEKSNPIVFGHSSNNLFNTGAYKFVFVLLDKLENGDTFIINYESKQYVYRVFSKKIVKPTEVEVLSEQPLESMMTLITCDPPGTSTNRLVVQGEQISPDPITNTATTADQSATPAVIPSNSESLFRRLFGWVF